MKILIGTPIHQLKDYAMERWLENVSRLQKVSPSDVLLIDNSFEINYVKKVKDYCNKYGIKNYKIKHIELNQELSSFERIEISQEEIRKYMLSHDYDAWFSWECDQIIPNDALHKLIKIMQDGNFMMVIHNSWARWDSTILNANMGVTLIKREILKKYGFLPTTSDSQEVIYKRRVLKGLDNYLEVYGVIKPIYHLDE